MKKTKEILDLFYSQKKQADNRGSSVRFCKVDTVPPPKRHFSGEMTSRTKECLFELSNLSFGEIVRLPISEDVPEPFQKSTLNKYKHSIITASKHLIPKEFTATQRGKDLFVMRVK
ncbi:hypothetical protein ACFLZN_00210 [Nanoarchaeota archaeon]